MFERVKKRLLFFVILELKKVDGKPNWKLYTARQRLKRKREVEKNKEDNRDKEEQGTAG